MVIWSEWMERRLRKKIYRVDVGGIRRKGRSRRRWMNGAGEFGRGGVLVLVRARGWQGQK